MIKYFIINFIFLFKNKILFHSGYTSSIYLEKRGNDFVLRKCFVFKKKSKRFNITPQEMLVEEIEGINFLNSIFVCGIVSPKIIEVNYSERWYIQKYFKLNTFNKTLFVNFFLNDNSLEKAFISLGKYLALLHKKNKRLHGDLNRKNILFGRGYVFICDPSFIKKQIYNNYTFDLFRIINNLYSYNPFIRCFFSKRDVLIKDFLRGYFENSDFVFNPNEFKRDVERYLDEINIVMSKKISSYLKYFIIKWFNNRIKILIKNNKLKWINEI